MSNNTVVKLIYNIFQNEKDITQIICYNNADCMWNGFMYWVDL